MFEVFEAVYVGAGRWGDVLRQLAAGWLNLEVADGVELCLLREDGEKVIA